jgi:catechol 2,3-dioxygenase-like lactoylglutathione lyase family enzyme
MLTLNHTIVPARDNVAAASWFARIFGLDYRGAAGHFAPVRIDENLTLDFDTSSSFEPHHYAFLVDDATFDAIFARVQGEGVAYGAEPWSPTDGRLNHRLGGRGVYFADPDGHLLELMTRA